MGPVHVPTDVLIILPTYNERENLPRVVEALLRAPDRRVLVVDDASPDGTGAVAEELAGRFPHRVHVLHRTGPRGLGLSYVDGFRHALADGAPLICQMDADLSHDPEHLPGMIDAAADADLVIGSRYLSGISVVNWPLRRLVLSILANAYVRRITGTPVRDCTSGFRCWRRETLAVLPLRQLRSNGYAFLVETLVEAEALGARVREVPIVFVERRLGASKLSTGVFVESLLTPWRLRLRYVRRRIAALWRP
jgi:dolichol-phosphate mannosyltransferase